MGELVRLRRVGVVGAGGALGRELLAVLEQRRLPIVELVPVGSADQTGEGVSFGGQDLPLRPPDTPLAGLDVVFLCAPADRSLDHARRALHARVPCIDASGALARSEDVPLLDAEDPLPEAARGAPLLSAAGGAALAWYRVLAPLDREAGLRHVTLTAVESVSTAGRRGLEALSSETVALLSQQEAAEPEVLPWPIAFDCHPATDDADVAGASGREAALAEVLRRLLGHDLPLDLTVLRIPTFSGEGASLRVETGRPLGPADALACWAKAPGVEVVGPDAGALRTRASAGREAVLVGRVRPGATGGLLFWLAADTQRLSALNAARLAEARLSDA
jgi:aspartate-semialdehyde dehydrogenase